jgi:hypothetical protein
MILYTSQGIAGLSWKTERGHFRAQRKPEITNEAERSPRSGATALRSIARLKQFDNVLPLARISAC